MKARVYYLKFNAPVTDLPRAPALFGHLAWATLWGGGKEELENLLLSFENDPPPFLLSSTFPVAQRGEERLPLLPRPKVLPYMVEDTRIRKSLKKIRYLTFELFGEVARSGDEALARLMGGEDFKIEKGALVPRGFKLPLTVEERTRVGIARTTGTHAPGVLFSDRATRLEEAVVYARFTSEIYGAPWFLSVLKEVGKYGFGGKKSIGYGSFEVEDGGEIELPEAEGANAHTLLSPALPPDGDGWYSLEPYWGRLGEHFALSSNPFKRLYLRAVEGSTFRSRPGGSLLDVTPEPAPEPGVSIREYLFPLTLGVRV